MGAIAAAALLARSRYRHAVPVLGALGTALYAGRYDVLGHPGQIPIDGLVLDAATVALLVAAPFGRLPHPQRLDERGRARRPGSRPLLLKPGRDARSIDARCIQACPRRRRSGRTSASAPVAPAAEPIGRSPPMPVIQPTTSPAPAAERDTLGLVDATKLIYGVEATEYLPGLCNIGPAEIAFRRRAGHVGTAATIGLLAVLVATRAPRPWRALIALPAAGAASGYLQARHRFCAAYGSRGVYGFGALGAVSDVVDPEARALDRATSRRIGRNSGLIGLAAAALALALPRVRQAGA